MPIIDQGFDSTRFSVIPRTLTFIFNEGQVLLLLGAENKKIWAGKYNGIGGHIEAGEDILESALRELAEETGITDISLRLCGQVMITLNQSEGIALFIFKGNYLGQEFKSSHEGDLEWIALKDLQNLPVVEDIPVLIKRLTEHRLDDPLFFGKYHYEDDRLVMLFR